VYANADPDPKAQGGAARLRAGGLEVEPGVGGKAGAALNAPFLWAHARPERPFVAVKLATSLDGFLADATSASRWISGAEAREYVHWLRAGFDALAVGRRTAEVDDPALTVRGPVAPRVPPVRVIWTASGAIRAGLKVFTTLDAAPTWVVTTPSRTQDVGRRLGLEPDAVLGADGVVAGLQALRGRGVGALLVEGGGALAGALWAADVVDRLYWIQAPLWLGSGVSAFGGHRPSPLGEARAWVVTERRPLGVDTLLVVDRTLCLPES
jgi:diaminohydroxyphosphoribosylaminopyrimidine deaminase/5-amino-6-(5-phosphoribosylamino)uracil reductase